MAHIHGVYDCDTHFKIDGTTRTVKNMSEVKTQLVQYDHNSERFTFEIPRMIDGHDMSLCDVVEVHFLNVDTSTRKQMPGVYKVDDLQISKEDENIVVGSWLISRSATQYVGELSFSICFACTADDGSIDYAWRTAVYGGLKVIETLYNAEVATGNGIGGAGGSVALDTTLTKSGMAADAAAVGEKVGQLADETAQNAETISHLSEEIVNQTREKPMVYIDGAIPSTKDNTLATMTVKSKWLNIFAYIKIKCQGSSSMNYPKKNFTVTLYQDEERTIPLYIMIPGWKHRSNKFVLKANYIDHSHARNVITARLWSEVVASRPDYDTLPDEFRNSPNNGAINGFPIIVYTNGDYKGIYTWNIGKDAWMWGMDEDNSNHVLLCGETNTNGVFAETPCNFRALWSGVNEEHWSVEVGTNGDAVKNALNALISCVKDTTDEEFVAQVGEHLDVQSAIDYYLFACADCGIDSLAKNLLLGTYDLKKWIMGQYDLDSTWGLWWDGSKFITAATVFPDGYQEKFNLLFERIGSCFAEQIKERGIVLRKTVLSYANINLHFERFAREIGAEAYADDLVPYPSIPSAETNNIWQLRNFVKVRLNYFDSWLGLGEENTLIKNGVYTLGDAATITVSDGNHIKVETTQYVSMLHANLTLGQVAGETIRPATDKVVFSTKVGDIVTIKLTNFTAVGFSENTAMSTNLINASGQEISFGNNIVLSDINGTLERSMTMQAADIAYQYLWVGVSGALGTIEFDLELYINDERLV